MKQVLSTALALAVTVLALVYALWDVDYPELWRVLRAGSYWAILPTWGLFALHYGLKARRWSALLRPLGHFSAHEVAPAMMVGFGANNLLPAHLGDLVRAVVFARRQGCSLAGVFTSLVVERLLDVVAILALFAAGAAVIGRPPDGMEAGALVIGVATVASLLGIALMIGRPDWTLALWQWGARLLPAPLRTRGGRLVQNAILGMSAMRAPGPLAAMLANSLLQWIVMSAANWCAVWAYGVTISPAATAVLIAVSAFAVFLPTAPGYVGTMQAAYVFSLVPFGVSREVAFAASMFYLVAHWVPVTAAGVLYFFTTGWRLDELRQQVDTQQQHQP